MRIHINIDHVATIRNARGTRYPDPVFAAHLCENAGADGITAHLREDRRHIRDDDIQRLRHAVLGTFNLEMAVTDEMLNIAEEVGPDVITLVPERREERTTEGGLDVAGQAAGIERTMKLAERLGARVSLFIAADEATVRASHELGVHQIELHTGDYCHAADRRSKASGTEGRRRAEDELARLVRAAELGQSLGMEVAAGHGLTRHNVGPVVAIQAIEEVNIGHSVVADAVFSGLERAVQELRAAIERARYRPR